MIFIIEPGAFPAIHLADAFSLLHLIDRKQPRECELFRLALTQTALDVALYTEHDAEAAEDRYHQSSIQARSYPLQEGA